MPPLLPLVALGLLQPRPAQAELPEVQAARCTYTATVWNTVTRRTSRTVRVDKARTALSEAERGPFGCTPCEQDQVEVTLAAELRLRLCEAVLPKVMPALAEGLRAGAVIRELEGYRPSYSRGAASPTGERTELSNHAFGVALDINASWNGLYDRCPAWGPACRLRKGGPWQPEAPEGLSAAHPLVQALESAGWSWGGGLEGQQKDFMHFSPSGS